MNSVETCGKICPFKQRLRGVRAGAQVTVTFDDSPSVAAACTPAALAQGQAYTVEGDGGQVSTRTTAPDPAPTGFA
ncbi:hypothetical protein [Streptosporangium roseum]|uniref:hypothetical protein n=1 Tax=Streptosporangium roseum TaxID=2001 RepID=UPI00332B018B